MKKNILLSIILLSQPIFAAHHNTEELVYKDKIPGFVIYIQGNTRVSKNFDGSYDFIPEEYNRKPVIIRKKESAKESFDRLEGLYSSQNNLENKGNH